LPVITRLVGPWFTSTLFGSKARGCPSLQFTRLFFSPYNTLMYSVKTARDQYDRMDDLARPVWSC